MISVSSKFQPAVDAGRTMVRLQIGGKIIDNASIVNGGLIVDETLCPTGGNYSIGNATASTINFSILDDDGRWSNLRWGETRAYGYATDGAWTAITAKTGKTAMAESDYAPGSGYIYAADDTITDATDEEILQTSVVSAIKYLDVNGARMLALGTGGVSLSYVGDGSWESSNFSWAEFGTTRWSHMSGIYGRELIATVTDAETIAAMNRQSSEKGKGSAPMRGRYESDSELKDFSFDSSGSWSRSWEGCPIGVFDVDKPESTKGKTIDCTGFGIMARLDNIEMDDFSYLFPTTTRELLDAICEAAGILKNFTPVQNIALPENYWAGYSARDAMRHIAELDGANAVVNRYGALEFRKPTSSGLSFNNTRYTSVNIAEYTTPTVTGIALKNSESDVGTNVGTAAEVMTIMENPIIGSLDVMAQRTLANTLLNTVAAIGAYQPATADLFYGWQLEAGDIVTIVRDSVSYSIPIFGISYTITNSCLATITATGEEHRNDMMEQNREQYVSNRKRYELSKTVDGLLSAVYDENGNSKIEQTAGLLSAYVSKTGGAPSSFGWELTASSWSVSSNGQEVLKIDENGLTVNGSGKFNGELTCTKLIVGGTDYSVSNLQNIFAGGADAYGNGSNWSNAYFSTSSGGYCYNGGAFGANCWGSSYSARCVDASYLRMYSGGRTYVCTISAITINNHTYYIPCVE